MTHRACPRFRLTRPSRAEQRCEILLLVFLRRSANPIWTRGKSRIKTTERERGEALFALGFVILTLDKTLFISRSQSHVQHKCHKSLVERHGWLPRLAFFHRRVWQKKHCHGVMRIFKYTTEPIRSCTNQCKLSTHILMFNFCTATLLCCLTLKC